MIQILMVFNHQVEAAAKSTLLSLPALKYFHRAQNTFTEKEIISGNEKSIFFFKKEIFWWKLFSLSKTSSLNNLIE